MTTTSAWKRVRGTLLAAAMLSTIGLEASPLEASPVESSANALTAAPYEYLGTTPVGPTTGGSSLQQFDGTSLWVAGGLNGTIAAIDPATGTSTVTQVVTNGSGEAISELAVDATYVWALVQTSDDTVRLYRIARADSSIVDFTVSSSVFLPADIATDGSNVYVSGQHGDLAKFDTSGNQLAFVSSGANGFAMEVASGNIWVNRGANVVRYRTSDLAVQATIPVPGADNPAWIDTDANDVWSISYSGVVGRVSKASDTVTTYTAPASIAPWFVASDGTTLWVTGLKNLATWAAVPFDITTATWGNVIDLPYPDAIDIGGLEITPNRVWSGGRHQTDGPALFEFGPPRLHVVPTAHTLSFGAAVPADSFFTFRYFSDAGHTVEVFSPTLVSAPVCTSDYTVGGGLATISCSGGDGGVNYSLDMSATASLTVEAVGSTTVPTTTGGPHAVGATLSIGATVTPSSGTAECPTVIYGEGIWWLLQFTLDRDPLTGAVGPYILELGDVSTADWTPGLYRLTVAYEGSWTQCSASSAELTLAIGVPLPIDPPPVLPPTL